MIEVIKELNPNLTGILYLDGKAIKKKGESKHSQSLFIGFDSIGLPIHQRLMEGENKQDIMNFLKELKEDINYSFRGIVSDMGGEIISAVSQIMPKIPYQFCKTHILRGIDRILKI